MNTNFEIRHCGMEDTGSLSEVAINAYRDYYLYLWNDNGDWYINRSFSESQFKKELSDPNAEFFILLLNESPIGFIKINLDLSLPGFEHLDGMELERIYLLKSASRKGYGRKALEFCFEYARKRNKEIMWLKSMDSSDALHFYYRLGFQEVGEFFLDFKLMKPEYRGMKILMKSLT